MTRDMLTDPSTSDSRPPGKSSELYTNLASADRIISFWHSNASKHLMLFEHRRRKEPNEYLAAVDGLRHLMENLVVNHRSSAELVRAQRLMEVSMIRLKIEFHRILSTNVEPTMAPDDGNSSHASSDEESTDEERSSSGRHRGRNYSANEICEIDMMPLGAVQDLRSIAKRMVAAGYGRECVRIYGQARSSVLEGCVKRIGVDQLSTSDVQKMKWEILDSKIKMWVRAIRIAVRILFASEKLLCDEIFPGLNNVRDFSFSEVVKGPTAKLLAFGESVSMCKRSSERLFGVLDMYETLSDLMPDIETVYCQESSVKVRTQASMILLGLRESARGILTEFENSVQLENSKTPVTGGTIHPLTRYVMNYLSFLSDYKDLGLFGDLDGQDNEWGTPVSALSVKLEWIIIILLCKLDLKSNLYKNVPLSYLFLMNNLHYIVKKVKDSKLLGLLGFDWLRKNQEKVRHFAANYERAAWMKALNCLSDDGIHVSGGLSAALSQQALNDRLKSFNFAIEEVLRNHSGWMVPDVELQEGIGISIAEKMIPAYRSFLAEYLESGSHSEMYIKYTTENLEGHILDLFHGNPSSLSSRRS